MICVIDICWIGVQLMWIYISLVYCRWWRGLGYFGFLASHKNELTSDFKIILPIIFYSFNISLSLSLSLSLYLSLSHLSLFLSIASLSLSIYLCLSQSLSLLYAYPYYINTTTICQFTFIFMFKFKNKKLENWLYLSIHPSIQHSVYLQFVRLSV